MGLRQEQVKEWAKELCRFAGADESFFEDFWMRLLAAPDVYEEFAYYLEHQDFLYKVKVEGYGLVDLMIFQMDHFRATMDQNVASMRHNKDKMLLMAFNSLLLMQKNPQPFLRQLSSQSGTDSENPRV